MKENAGAMNPAVETMKLGHTNVEHAYFKHKEAELRVSYDWWYYVGQPEALKVTIEAVES